MPCHWVLDLDCDSGHNPQELSAVTEMCLSYKSQEEHRGGSPDCSWGALEQSHGFSWVK